VSVRAALWAECARLDEVLLGLTEAEYARSTLCPPWTVRDLLAHVRTGVGRVTVMLAQPAPPRAEVDAAGYFAPAKFAPATDAARVEGARREAAASGGGRELAADLARVWRATRAAIAGEPGGRVVRTRHGDAMTLDDFLLTRVVEVGVHGLDLAAALGREPWLTGPAAEVIAGLLLGAGDEFASLGWDRLTLIGKATGRVPLTGAERGAGDRYGLRGLSRG
jgi:uncharacterized protein (TIGR03083 family)